MPPDIEQVIAAFGEQVFKAYHEEKFPTPALRAMYPREDVEDWLEVSTFKKWGAQYLQSQSSAPRKRGRSPSPAVEIKSEPVTIDLAGSDSDLPDFATINKSVPKRKKKKAARTIIDIDDSPSDTSSRPRKRVRRQTKKKKKNPVSEDVIELSEDSAPEPEHEGGGIRITKLTRVYALIKLLTLPLTWEVPRDGKCTAYLIDLNDDGNEWVDENGEPMSMVSIIKSQSLDSWSRRGSAGSAGASEGKKRTPYVHPLGTDCQAASFKCGGAWHCSELDPDLLPDDYERFEIDEEEMHKFFTAEREVNVEAASNEARAVSFYQGAIAKPCGATDEHGNTLNCDGQAVYRVRKDGGINFDGKKGFIGCSNYRQGKLRSHRFMPIPGDLMEDLVQKVFRSKGKAPVAAFSEKNCARILHPSVGKKGKGECPYPHSKDGQVVKGRITERLCNAEIRIWCPTDRNDRRAVVMLWNAHNHPMFPPTKLTREAKEKYKEAATELQDGNQRVTVLNVDKAPSTSKIFGTHTPAAFHPALANNRAKRDIIQAVKKQAAPLGNDLAGVLALHSSEKESLPAAEQYVHKVICESEYYMIVTMLPGLAARVHTADATLHDNTYKRSAGDWKEWEVVVWDRKLNMRLTIARIYCTRETSGAFKRMWTELWDTIGVITGRPVKFKFIDGSGLKGILVDGCKAQVEGLGKDLNERAVRLGHAEYSGVQPEVIVQKILRTCVVHLDRKFDDMAVSLPREVMDRVRGVRFLESKEDVDEFVDWCLESPHKVIRDWMADKVPHAWWVPSINEFMTQIPRDDWYSIPSSTNMNESAHPHTNMQSGINLAILDAIKGARSADMRALEKVEEAERNCILPNPHNTQAQRDQHNQRRRETHAKSSAARAAVQAQISEIDDKIKALELEKKDYPPQKERSASDRASVAEVNASIARLRADKQQLQEDGSIKRSPTKQAARGKARRDYEDLAADTLIGVDDLADGAIDETANGGPDSLLEAGLSTSDTPYLDSDGWDAFAAPVDSNTWQFPEGQPVLQTFEPMQSPPRAQRPLDLDALTPVSRHVHTYGWGTPARIGMTAIPLAHAEHPLGEDGSQLGVDSYMYSI